MDSSQLLAQASVIGDGGGASSQLLMEIAYSPPAAKSVRSSGLYTDASVAEAGVPRSSQLLLEVAYRTGSIGNLENRAWAFSLDGHTFYCLTLGEQGTFVFDESTGKWARWQTAGLPGWNMELGTTWKGKIIAADQSEPIIYQLTPGSFLDDGFKTQTRVVTGGLAMRNRTFIANYSFRVTASLGQPDVGPTLPETQPIVNLSFSDDQGRTFQDAGDVVITSLDYTQEIQWLSLGTMRPPQRVFKLTDTGAIARIDGADADIGEEGE